MKIGISSCLLGYNVRYDGSNKRNDELIELLKDFELIPVCPEISAGFSVPRLPIEIRNGRVISKAGIDLHDDLMKGSGKCFEQIKDCEFVILKSKSPSCGYKKIYDGSFSGRLIDGDGLFASLCLEHRLKVFTELDIEKIREYILQ